MRQSAPRSLKHEYDLYIENEIDAYKESISRATLLKIGDEAVASLQSGMQFSMNELLLVVEVDKSQRSGAESILRNVAKHEIKRQRDATFSGRRTGVEPDSAVARRDSSPADSPFSSRPSAEWAALPRGHGARLPRSMALGREEGRQPR